LSVNYFARAQELNACSGALFDFTSMNFDAAGLIELLTIDSYLAGKDGERVALEQTQIDAKSRYIKLYTSYKFMTLNTEGKHCEDSDSFRRILKNIGDAKVKLSDELIRIAKLSQ
jgi:hypothetical protein